MSVDVRLLGSPSAWVNEEQVSLHGRPLMLLARLALALPASVSVRRLVDDLWPDGSGTDGALRVNLTRVRKAIGDDRLVRVDGGYTLHGGSTDVARFEQQVRAGRDRSSSIDRRIRSYGQALVEWRGTPLDGFEPVGWVTALRLRLDELHEQAVDERIELVMLQGGHESVLPELSAAMNRTPTREHRAGLLAIALYRSGRQAEALSTIDGVRRELLERMGLDMGPLLRAVELRILQHDPELASPELVRMESSAVEVDARLRAAMALLRAGVVAETAAIIDDAEQVALRADDRRSLCMAWLTRARLQMWSGDGDPDLLLSDARQIARQLHDGRLLAACGIAQFGRGLLLDKGVGLVELLEPIPLLPPTAPEVVELLCCAAATVTFADGSGAADRLLEEARRVHRRDPSERTEAIVMVVTSIVSAAHGRDTERVHREAWQAYEMARASGDPSLVVVAAQAALRVAYDLGDIDRVDGLLDDLDGAARDAMLPFGVMRVALCRTINAAVRGDIDGARLRWDEALVTGHRLRTHAAEVAARMQRLLFMLEDADYEAIGVQASIIAATRPEPGIWHALHGLADADAAQQLVAALPTLVRDDTFDSFVAVASLAAQRHAVPELASWCAAQFATEGHRTVVVGLGTMVMGHRDHFAGVALAVTGDLDAAGERLRSAMSIAERHGTWLWWGHSAVELAAVCRALGDDATARDLVEQVRRHPVGAASARLAARCDAVAGGR